MARQRRLQWQGWQACEVLKGLPEQRVIAQNGADGHREHRSTERCLCRGEAENAASYGRHGRRQTKTAPW